MLERHLQELEKEFGFAASAVDELQMRKLRLGNIEMSIKELDPGLYFYTPLAPTPQPKKEELLTLLMKANFLGQGTGGSVIGLTEDESFLTLSLALPYEMDYKAFREAVEDFVNFIDYWKGQIVKFR